MVARAAGARPPRAATVARGVVATANMLAGVVMTTRGARIRCYAIILTLPMLPASSPNREPKRRM